jgi:asparagine synthase (glutamine-hydrolysing)
MCGICGIVTPDGPADLDLLRRMTARLHHRGPDGHGYVRDHHAALGHTRLSIIDVAGGAQPMGSDDGSLWLTFNGEIFNYIEVREQLRGLGHRFRTESDTEVVLRAWQQWGRGCFSRFNGQWALALWDRRERRLVLSRDRLGIRPLYYTRTRDAFLFASEVKALFADPAVERGFDPAGLEQTFTYWSPIAPRTAFRGVGQLPPGHVAVLDARGFSSEPYWSMAFPERGREQRQDLEENTAALRERVIEATRLRFLRSDVPVGAYLSGGIDSAVTAAVITRYTDSPVDTYSLRFSDPEYDEGPYQKEMAATLGSRHRDVVISPADIGAVFPQVVAHTETPILRAAPAPLFLLARLVAESGHKVVVTGEGADEMLAGYDLFREARVRQFWARDPASAGRYRAAGLLYPWMARSPGAAPAFARSFFGRNLDPADPALSHRPRWDSTAVLQRLLTAELRESIAQADGLDLVASMPPGSEAWDPLSRAQWLEATTLLPGYILSSQGDRMAMAHGVEGRFPFLDRDVVQLANALPPWQKLFGLDEKHILKRAFADLVPEAILNRPKQPYRAPDAASFFADTRQDWFDHVTSPDAVRAAGVFDPALVAGLVAKCTRTGGERMSNTDNMRILAVVSTQLLHADLLSRGGAAHTHPAGTPSVAVDLVPHDRSTR